MTTKLFPLLEKYLTVYDGIHKNREGIKELTDKNRKERVEINLLKRQIIQEARLACKRESLYRLCLEQYGKIDKRFHTLYALLGKR